MTIPGAWQVYPGVILKGTWSNTLKSALHQPVAAVQHVEKLSVGFYALTCIVAVICAMTTTMAMCANTFTKYILCYMRENQ